MFIIILSVHLHYTYLLLLCIFDIQHVYIHLYVEPIMYGSTYYIHT